MLTNVPQWGELSKWERGYRAIPELDYVRHIIYECSLSKKLITELFRIMQKVNKTGFCQGVRLHIPNPKQVE